MSARRHGGLSVFAQRHAVRGALYDANPDEDLHVMLCTLGGDGETALRLVRKRNPDATS